MYKKIEDVEIFNSEKHRDFFIEYPHVCPCCRHALIPEVCYKKSVYDYKGNSIKLFVVFFCANCDDFFSGHYQHSLKNNETYLISFEPRNESDKKSFSENIEKMSPRFCEIYNQAYTSQQLGLYEISGMGYRKALEVLVKDYAIFTNPNKEDDIKKKFLDNCIKTYIKQVEISNLATASAWLGNDEAHYERRYENYDVNSLVAFINTIVSYVDMDLNVDDAKQLLLSRKKLTPYQFGDINNLVGIILKQRKTDVRN